MGKVVYTPDNTYNYILIIITILLGYGLYKIFNIITKIHEKIQEKPNEDPGQSGITVEEKIQDHLESLDAIKEENNEE